MDRNFLEIRTSQVSAFAETIRMLAKHIVTCNIIFYAVPSQNHQGGISITEINREKSLLMKINFGIRNFEYFYCKENRFVIELDAQSLLEAIDREINEEYLNLYMVAGVQNLLFINGESNSVKCNIMNGYEPFSIPNTTFQNKITICSDKFKKILMSIKAHGENTVSIGSEGSNISFGSGKQPSKNYHVLCDKYYNVKTTGKTCGIFDLDEMLTFKDHDYLSNTTELYLKNDFPLVQTFPIATLGKMYIFYSPVEIYLGQPVHASSEPKRKAVDPIEPLTNKFQKTN